MFWKNWEIMFPGQWSGCSSAQHPPPGPLLGPLSHQRRPSAWAYYLGAILWPDPAYIATFSDSPSRLAYLRSSL